MRVPDAAHVRREDAGGVMGFVVENENVYPRQAAGIRGIIEADLTRAARPKVLVDLRRVEFICSTFIGGLVLLHKLAKERSGEVKLHVTGERAAYTMKLVKLHKIMETGGDREKLIESVC